MPVGSFNSITMEMSQTIQKLDKDRNIYSFSYQNFWVRFPS